MKIKLLNVPKTFFLKKLILKNGLFSLLFCLVLGILQAKEKLPGLEHFHVCTIASRPHGGLDKLNLSCKLHGIDLKILAMGKKWYYNATKFSYLHHYLNTLQDDEIIMFLDAFDVLVIADKEEIYKRFLAMNTPFVMAAEKNCAPDGAVKDLYPQNPSPFKYVNTGTFIGYVRNVKRMLEDMVPIDPHDCDQRLTTMYFLNAPENNKPFILDYGCNLFLPLFWVDQAEVTINPKNKTVICNPTKSRPCILHANGQSYGILNRVYDLWYKKYEHLYPAPYK